MSINFRKYAGLISGSKHIFLLNLADKIFSFIIMLLLARYMPEDVYGMVVTVIALSMVFISVFDLGLPIYIQREIAVNKNNASEIFSRVFITGSVIFSVYYITLCITAHFVYPRIPFAILTIISAMMYISFLVTVSGKALSGINEYRAQLNAFIFPRIPVLIIFAAGIYLYSFGINTLMLLMLTGIIFNLLLALMYLLKNNIGITAKGFTAAGIGKMISISIPLGLAVIFNFLYDKIDLLLISKLTDFTQAAYYNIAYGLYKSSSLGFSFLLVAGFTRVSSLNRNVSELKNFFKEHAEIISVICIFMTVILYFLPVYIVDFIYTDKFSASIPVLQILSFGILAMGLNNLTGIIINGMGYFKIVMYITLYALVMNIVLNAVFIPAYGIKAAAILTVVTEYFILILEWIYMKKIFSEISAGQN